ncbi:uncharacterized protein TM_1410 [Deinococcus depolymerans]|uniref:MJ1477/TM1410 family putative glycoside hydrolase n=1 Tax=Deinococcus depolymerans TaxID=392408 RepID=UPI0030A68773
MTAALLALLACAAGLPGEAAGTDRAARLLAARRWAYHLSDYPQRLRAVAASPFDLVVVDAEDDSGVPWPAAELRAARRRAGHPDRLLLGYLSVGAAERDRAYWQPGWTRRPPAWLLGEQPDWPGNYDVAYWDAAWQALTLARLDRLLASGFDGAYLDLVDAFEGHPARPGARREMVAWVCRVARHARTRDPQFLIVPQNAAGLIRDAGYAGCVDALGQEETFSYAMNVPTGADRQAELAAAFRWWRAAGKPVFTVEYADREPLVAQLYARARAWGLVPYVTVRNADVLTPGR